MPARKTVGVSEFSGDQFQDGNEEGYQARENCWQHTAHILSTD
jgi:hypothetical protein